MAMFSAEKRGLSGLRDTGPYPLIGKTWVEVDVKLKLASRLDEELPRISCGPYKSSQESKPLFWSEVTVCL